VTCLIVGFTVVTVGFLISGLGVSLTSGLISGVFSRQGHSGHCVPVHETTLPLKSSGVGQLADAQLNSVNVSSPSKPPSTHVLVSDVHVCSPVVDLKNSLDVPFAKIRPFNSQFDGSCSVQVSEGSGS
jgi:hypothetical protein